MDKNLATALLTGLFFLIISLIVNHIYPTQNINFWAGLVIAAVASFGAVLIVKIFKK